jgi:hypothetical protein
MNDLASFYTTQNDLLLNNLLYFFKNEQHLNEMLKVITGESRISLRIVDWFATNFSKKHYTVYDVTGNSGGEPKRFKVYVDYKLKLKAYSKKRFDPFCRWERINIPYLENKVIETTIGQLNFFKWILENEIIRYIEENYVQIEQDMNCRNSISKKEKKLVPVVNGNDGVGVGGGGGGGVTDDVENGCCTNGNVNGNGKTRKKREELTVSATKSIKKEDIHVVLKFQ